MKHYKLNGEIYNSLFLLKRALKNVSFPQNITDEMLIDLGVEVILVDIVEPTLKELKTEKLIELDTFIANKIVGGFISTATGEPVTYDSDVDTQITMQCIAINCQSERFSAEYPNGCPVRGYPEGNTAKEIFYLSANQILHWCGDLSIHIGACKQIGWGYQVQINNVATIEELNAITFE